MSVSTQDSLSFPACSGTGQSDDHVSLLSSQHYRRDKSTPKIDCSLQSPPYSLMSRLRVEAVTG